MSRETQRKQRNFNITQKYHPWITQTLIRDNYTCKCGNKNALVVHHKDGMGTMVSIDEMNNDLDNLETLCRSCHAIAHGWPLKFSNPNKRIIIELRNQGQSYAKIGEYLGITRQRVHQILKKPSY